MDDELVLYALTGDGVTEVRSGDTACRSLGGTLVVHSYPPEGGDGVLCACGETRRGDQVEPEEEEWGA